MMNRNSKALVFDTGEQGRLANIKPISDVVLLLLIF